ncbi:MAG TPA: type II toxin-antitoxin system VapC family toxin [Thermoflexia bacterium]|nr:type II toxin-antitoxin system VapC family toxin [Thermoflexia bacterium]
MGETYALDSFAVLALLGSEPGSEEVARLMRQAHAGRARLLMTWVNVGEVVYIVERRWGKERVHQVLAALEATGVEILPVGRDLALTAASIKARHPLAYADAFVAALAMRERAALVTGDPEFKGLEEQVQILWLPRGEQPGME